MLLPSQFLNGVQYSATQIMYNATSGHAVIYVGPLLLNLRQFPWVVHGVTLFDGCVIINPLSVVLLSDHSMASSRIIVMKNKIDRITIPQKLGK